MKCDPGRERNKSEVSQWVSARANLWPTSPDLRSHYCVTVPVFGHTCCISFNHLQPFYSSSSLYLYVALINGRSWGVVRVKITSLVSVPTQFFHSYWELDTWKHFTLQMTFVKVYFVLVLFNRKIKFNFKLPSFL